jgi:hypothetical protein
MSGPFFGLGPCGLLAGPTAKAQRTLQAKPLRRTFDGAAVPPGG